MRREHALILRLEGQTEVWAGGLARARILRDLLKLITLRGRRRAGRKLLRWLLPIILGVVFVREGVSKGCHFKRGTLVRAGELLLRHRYRQL
jgi:hypothetical protein